MIFGNSIGLKLTEMNYLVKTAAAMAAAAAGLLSLNSCNGGKQISGTLDDAGNDSLSVFIYNARTNDLALSDTVVAKNGKINIGFKDTAAFFVYVTPLRNANGTASPVLMLPGEKVKVSGSISDPVFSGTEISDGIASFGEFGKIQEEFQNLYRKAMTIAEDDIIGQQTISAEHQALLTKRDSIFSAYVQANPDDLTSGYLTLFMNPEKGLESYNMLGSSVKESAMGAMLSDLADQFASSLLREKNKSEIQPGKTAPDFSLKDIDGNMRTLSSFRGKYVLLDFWGKWCYWCMKGMPDMKKYYEKYSDKIEFVGIDCNDSEEVWKKTVQEEGLTWTNLYNGDSRAIPDSYAIEGFPTKILIDRDGKIVQVFVGESEELYNKLDELF